MHKLLNEAFQIIEANTSKLESFQNKAFVNTEEKISEKVDEEIIKKYLN